MSEETSNEMDTTPGIVSWNELMTRDAAASAKFYTALFGWTREDLDTGAAAYRLSNWGGKS
jgi:predicted enzyme related to lactoylglutathione lyase